MIGNSVGWGSLAGECEYNCLLGCDSIQSGRYLLIFEWNLHLPSSGTLMMQAAGFSEIYELCLPDCKVWYSGRQWSSLGIIVWPACLFHNILCSLFCHCRLFQNVYISLIISSSVIVRERLVPCSHVPLPVLHSHSKWALFCFFCFPFWAFVYSV